jgi:hypothetical protein
LRISEAFQDARRTFQLKCDPAAADGTGQVRPLRIESKRSEGKWLFHLKRSQASPEMTA